MASNASDDGQTNILILSTGSGPTAPTDLQRASDHSLDGNADASTTDFQQEKYEGIKWKRLLCYHIPYLTTADVVGPWARGS